MAITKICLNRGCKKPETSKRGGKVCQCEKPSWKYQTSVTDQKSGRRIRYCYKTKKEAIAQEAKLVSLKAEKRDFLEVKPGYTRTFSELAEKYEVFKRDDVKRFDDNIKMPLERAREHFGDSLLASIGTDKLSEFMAKFKKDFEEEYNRKPSGSAINKQVSLLSNLFTMAIEWGMLDKSPFDLMKRNGQKKNRLRVKELGRGAYLTPDEINKLLEEAPDHLREIIIVAVNTGMRKGEILKLKWTEVAAKWIYLKKTKTDRERRIPINGDVERVLKVIKARQMRKGIFKKDGRVFLFDGKPLSSTSTAWYSTCRRAGITCRFHDLRHTFASWYLKKRKNLAALQKLLGHKEITMTMRYAHFIEEDLVEEMEAMAGMINVNHLPTHGKTAEAKLL